MDRWGGKLVPGRHHGKPWKPVGIVVSRSQRIEGPLEPVAGLSKLRVKFLGYLRSHSVAAPADARPERRDHIFRPRAEFHAHSTQGLFGNAAKGAPPSGMYCGNSPIPAVGEKYGNTVRRLHNEEDSAFARDCRIRPWSRFAPRLLAYIRSIADWMHNIRMNLPESHDAHSIRIQCAEEFLAILQDARSGVPIGETQV